MVDTPGTDMDLARIKYGAGLILAAFILLALVFAFAVWQFDTAQDVSAAVGVVAGVVGTIIGAFFGVQAGSAGREAAEAGRARAEDAARTALAMMDPDVGRRVASELRERSRSTP
jgi:hypothetical protein